MFPYMSILAKAFCAFCIWGYGYLTPYKAAIDLFPLIVAKGSTFGTASLTFFTFLLLLYVFTASTRCEKLRNTYLLIPYHPYFLKGPAVFR